MSYLKTAERAARKAGEILTENLGKIMRIELKAKNSLLTEVDLMCERVIVDLIRHEYPDHDLVAEEGSEYSSGSEFKWIIDPLDGTMNYAHGYPFFSVSIALEQNDSVVAGVVYDPVMDEMFTAEAGKGAKLNGSEIRVSAEDRLEDSLLATGFLHEDEGLVERNLGHFSDFIMIARGVRRDGSAALDLAYVACGRYDGFWELGLHPWDMAAGAFIVREAGGEITNISGGDFTHYKGEIVASNGKIHDQVLEILAQYS